MFGDQWSSVSAARIKDMIQIPGLETTDNFIPSHFKRNCQLILMQIAQTTQAPVLSFSWCAEQSKPVERSVPTDLPVPQPLLHCPLPSPVSLLPGSSSPATTSLQTNKKIPKEIKKKKTFPDSQSTSFHFLQSISSLGLSLSRGVTGDSHPSEMPFPAGPLSPHSAPFLLNPWATEGRLKLIINNVAHLTQKGRARALSKAQRPLFCPSLFLPVG